MEKEIRQEENSKKGFPRWALILVLAIAAGLVIYLSFNRFDAKKMEATPSPTPAATPLCASLEADFNGLAVYFLDVGQGDCIFLRSPGGKTMLVDAGPPGSFGIIRRFLDGQHVEKLDLVIATHLHSDHIGSMEEIVNSYPVGSFYMTPFDIESSLYAGLLSALDDHHIQPSTIYADRDAIIPWDDWTEVRVLSPYRVTYEDENDTSLMLRVSYLNTAVLLAGDAGAVAERLAVKALPNHLLKADVLKVGHHGSDTSSTSKFLSAVKPKIAVISCGKDNSYGLPDEGALKRLKKTGAYLYETDLDGTVVVALDGTNAWVVQ